MAAPLSKHQRHNRKRRSKPETNDNARRVYVGINYVGMAPTAEHAQALNNEARKEFHDR